MKCEPGTFQKEDLFPPKSQAFAMKGGFAMEWCQLDAKKCLEFSKKMAVLRKLVRLGLISENEYILAKNKIMSSYHILESEYFKSNAENKVA